MKRRRESKGKLPSLPHERKALAERYTIDADEAGRRTQRAAEEAAAEEAARAAASVALDRELVEQAQGFVSAQSEREVVPEPADVEPLPDSSEQVIDAAPAQEEGAVQTAELPIYRWFGNG